MIRSLAILALSTAAAVAAETIPAAWSTDAHVAIDALVDSGAQDPAPLVRRYVARGLATVRIGERTFLLGSGVAGSPVQRILVPVDRVIAIAELGNNQDFAAWIARNGAVPPISQPVPK